MTTPDQIRERLINQFDLSGSDLDFLDAALGEVYEMGRKAYMTYSDWEKMGESRKFFDFRHNKNK